MGYLAQQSLVLSQMHPQGNMQMQLKQRAMDLAEKEVRDLVLHGNTEEERGQDQENVNTEIDLGHILEKGSMTDTQEKGRETVSVTMRGHTVVKGTMTEQEI